MTRGLEYLATDDDQNYQSRYKNWLNNKQTLEDCHFINLTKAGNISPFSVYPNLQLMPDLKLSQVKLGRFRKQIFLILLRPSLNDS